MSYDVVPRRKQICRIIEPTAGAWKRGRCPSCRRPQWRKCKQCGLGFSCAWWRPQIFCKQTRSQANRRATGKLADLDRLRRLYLIEKLSTPKIAALVGCEPCSVRSALRRAGVILRRHTRESRCQKPGCPHPAMKRRHPQRGGGGLYGTLCSAHAREHRRQWNRQYQKRRNPNGTKPGRPLAPAKPCAICGRLLKRLSKGRCRACRSYFTRHGQERPYRTDGRRKRTAD